jgi:hypothetical protein
MAEIRNRPVRHDHKAILKKVGKRSGFETAWTAVIKRRVSAYERGEATLVPAEEVFAKAKRIAAS